MLFHIQTTFYEERHNQVEANNLDEAIDIAEENILAEIRQNPPKFHSMGERV